MSTKRSLVIALLGAYSLLLSCSGAWAWQANINSGWASSVVADAAGNVIAAGSIENNGTGSAFTVIKFNGVTGAETWSRIINGTITGSDNSANAITLDGAGNVVVAGITNQIAGEEGGDSSFGDFTVIKLSAGDGSELWRQVINGSATNFFGSANAVAVDRAGNVVAAGRSRGSLGDFTVVKYNGATGAELWRQVTTGSVFQGECSDSANAVTVDSEGNVVAAGFLCNLPNPNELRGIFTVIKYNGATGAELWRQAASGGAGRFFFEMASSVAVDAGGNIVAAGHTRNSVTGLDFTVIKFDGVTGAGLWRQVINSGSANAVALDARGNVVAAGSANNGSGPDFTAIKFDGATGAELWRRAINGAGSGSANAVVIDARGNVVAAGSTNNGSGPDFTAIKFDGATGAELWRQVINGAGSGSANAVAVDTRGNVVAAGSTGSNFTVVKFNSSSTTVDFDGDGKSDIAVYRDGIWYVIRSSDGVQTAVGWGGPPQDIPVPADYDGDGKTDQAVYRDGVWFILRSSDSGVTVISWGGPPQDIPVPADYDGDGKTDQAVYRDGVWFILRSSDGVQTAVGWGGPPQDIPVPADYDGDGKTDQAVYRDGVWFILRSSDSGVTVISWGGPPQDIPVPADYDGDGKADLAVYRDGYWFILRSSNGAQTAVGWGGLLQDKPMPGDYDGDGKTDLAVYREGVWFILRSSDGDGMGITWGGPPQDIPLK